MQLICLNRPALGGTVPNYTTMSRRPALLTFCPAFTVLGGTSFIRVQNVSLSRFTAPLSHFLALYFFVYIYVRTDLGVKHCRSHPVSPARIARISRGQYEPL